MPDITVTQLAMVLRDRPVPVSVVRLAGDHIEGTVLSPEALAESLLEDITGTGWPMPPAALSGDPELEALDLIVGAMTRLESEASGGTVDRVLHYLCERYGVEFQP